MIIIRRNMRARVLIIVKIFHLREEEVRKLPAIKEVGTFWLCRLISKNPPVLNEMSLYNSCFVCLAHTFLCLFLFYGMIGVSFSSTLFRRDSVPRTDFLFKI